MSLYDQWPFQLSAQPCERQSTVCEAQPPGLSQR